MRLTSIQLGDEPLLSPEAVGFDHPVTEVEERVELGLRQICLGQEVREKSGKTLDTEAMQVFGLSDHCLESLL